MNLIKPSTMLPSVISCLKGPTRHDRALMAGHLRSFWYILLKGNTLVLLALITLSIISRLWYLVFIFYFTMRICTSNYVISNGMLKAQLYGKNLHIYDISQIWNFLFLSRYHEPYQCKTIRQKPPNQHRFGDIYVSQDTPFLQDAWFEYMGTGGQKQIYLPSLTSLIYQIIIMPLSSPCEMAVAIKCMSYDPCCQVKAYPYEYELVQVFMYHHFLWTSTSTIIPSDPCFYVTPSDIHCRPYTRDCLALSDKHYIDGQRRYNWMGLVNT